MPTATSTIVKTTFPSQLPLKAGLLPTISPATVNPLPPQPQTASTSTLRSLYNRAARAFVLKDIPLTYSLIQSAFSLLQPPINLTDPLNEQRRKWDILRITFESTIYLLPSTSYTSLPEPLRDNLSETPPALANSAYARSLALFTPSNGSSQKPVLNAAYLPSQVLTTLIYFCLKLNTPDAARVMIEDWLARREPNYSLDSLHELDNSGYDKVIDLYCLHVLPKLDQWDYAMEFLSYESELPSSRREEFRSSLQSLWTQNKAVQNAQRSISSLPFSNSSTPRPPSPTPSSSSSSSSSLSTASNHTVVPSTSRGRHRSRSPKEPPRIIPVARAASNSATSSATATPRSRHAQLSSNGHHPPHSKSRTLSSASSVNTSGFRSGLSHQATAQPVDLSTYSLIRASVVPYITRSKVTTFVILFVVVPLVSFALRMRRRRLSNNEASGTIAAVSAVSNAELVRKRLQASGVESGLLSRTWGHVLRVVGDTVKMAGSGLV